MNCISNIFQLDPQVELEKVKGLNQLNMEREKNMQKELELKETRLTNQVNKANETLTKFLEKANEVDPALLMLYTVTVQGAITGNAPSEEAIKAFASKIPDPPHPDIEGMVKHYLKNMAASEEEEYEHQIVQVSTTEGSC